MSMYGGVKCDMECVELKRYKKMWKKLGKILLENNNELDMSDKYESGFKAASLFYHREMQEIEKELEG